MTNVKRDLGSKPIVEMTDEELVSQFNKSVRRLKYIEIVADAIIGTVIVSTVVGTLLALVL